MDGSFWRDVREVLRDPWVRVALGVQVLWPLVYLIFIR